MTTLNTETVDTDSTDTSHWLVGGPVDTDVRHLADDPASFKDFIMDKGSALADNPDTLQRQLAKAEQRVEELRQRANWARIAQKVVRSERMRSQMEAIVDGTHEHSRHQIATAAGSIDIKKYASAILNGINSKSGRISGSLNILKALAK